MTEIIVLRLVHVLGGIFWVGAALFNFMFMVPAMAAAGTAAGPIMATLRKRRLFVIMPTVALLTILSGARLMQLMSSNFSARYFETGVGATFGVSALAAILAFALGLGIALPAQRRMAMIGPVLASPGDEAGRAAAQSEMARLQARMGILGKVVSALLILAAAGMAIARYVG